MTYISLSGITGCVTPSSGETGVNYGIRYNTDKIVSYYKKDTNPNGNNSFVYQPFVVVVFENYTQNFIFDTAANRDTFYNSLP